MEERSHLDACCCIIMEYLSNTAGAEARVGSSWQEYETNKYIGERNCGTCLKELGP